MSSISNGVGPVLSIPARRELQEQLEYYSGVVAALKMLLSAAPISGRPTALNTAIALDAQRRAGRPGPKPKMKKPKAKRAAPTGAHTAKMRAQRTRTDKLLSTFDQFEPRPAPRGAAMGVLVARGYVTNVGDGQYVRTAKPFSIALPTNTQQEHPHQ